MTGTGGKQRNGSKTASRRAAATSRHTHRTLGNMQEMLNVNAGMRHIDIGYIESDIM